MIQHKKYTLRKTAMYGLVGCIIAGGLMIATIPQQDVQAEMIRSAASKEDVKTYQAFTASEDQLQSKRVRQHLQMTTPDGKTHDIIHDQVISRVKIGIEGYPYAYMYNMYLPTNFNAVGDIVMDTADYKANVDGILPETVSWQSKDTNYKVTYHKEATKSRFKDFKIVVRRYHFVFPDKEEFVTSRVKHFLTTLDGKEEDYDGKYATIPNANTLEFNAIPGYRVVEDATVKFDNQTKKYKATGPEISNAETQDKDIYIHLEKTDDKDVTYSFRPIETGKFSRTVHLINRSDESDVKKVTDSVNYLRFDVKRTHKNESGTWQQGLGEGDFSFALERDQQRLPMHKLPVSLKDYYAEVMLTKTGDQPTKVFHLGKTFKPVYGYTEDATYINSQSLIGNSYGLSHQFIEENVTFSTGSDKAGSAITKENFDNEKTPDAKDIVVSVTNVEDNSTSTLNVSDIKTGDKITSSKTFLAKYPADQFKVIESSQTTKDGKTTLKVKVQPVSNVIQVKVTNLQDKSTKTLSVSDIKTGEKITDSQTFLKAYPKDQFTVVKYDSKTENGKTVMNVEVKPVVATYTANVLVVDEDSKDKSQVQFTIEGVKEKDKVIESDAFKQKFPEAKYKVIDDKQTIIDGKFYAEILVNHQLIDKDGEPKKITRTIVMHNPLTQEMTKHSDSVTFDTTVKVDAVTGEKTDQVVYLQDELSFAAFELPKYDGFAPNVSDIEYTKAKPTDDAETTIDIHWSKLDTNDKEQTDGAKTQVKNEQTKSDATKGETTQNGNTNSAAKQTSSTQANNASQSKLPQAGLQEVKGLSLLGAVSVVLGSVGLAIRKKLGL